MYDVLQEMELKNAYVLHSLGLPRHRSKIYGEIDFVVVCERGVACMEIKGGHVECRQDILKPLYLYSLDCLLKGGLDKGRWVVFYDEKQNIYNPEYQEGVDIKGNHEGFAGGESIRRGYYIFISEKVQEF